MYNPATFFLFSFCANVGIFVGKIVHSFPADNKLNLSFWPGHYLDVCIENK